MNTKPVIPDHTLIRIIGRGAYGEVWLARNVMGSLRAVKVVWLRQFESDRPYEREFAGIQRYEPVSHASSGLVHVLHVGRNDAEGYFYYVMELADSATATHIIESGAAVRSEPLKSRNDDYEPRTLRSELNKRGRLTTVACVRLAMDVVGGLQDLHRHGLVHRDVKPGNIIYVHGRAKLADIGLVSVPGKGRTFVGTEGYIPPEGPGSPSADMYAVGIVLYEASTGYAPERFPDVPADWFTTDEGNDALEFHEIILKACEAQRERRYQSAESMEADVALLQSGQSVRRVRALERRYARLRLSGVVGTILLVCAIIAFFLANYRARLAAENRAKEMRLREQIQVSLERAEKSDAESRRQLYAALREQGRATVRSLELGQRVNALEAVSRAAVISNSASLRGIALAALALPDLRVERRLPLPPDNTLVEFDPTFSRFACCRGVEPVEIRAGADQKLLRVLPASTNLPAYGAHWSDDGKFLAVRRDHPNVQRGDWEIWEAGSGQRILLLQGVSGVSFAFHPRCNQFSAAIRRRIERWDAEHGQMVGELQVSEEPLQLVFSPNGERFATTHYVGGRWEVVVQNAGDGSVQFTRVFGGTPGNLSWNSDGNWLAIPDSSGAVSLVDTRTGGFRIIGRHKAEAVFAAFGPKSNYLLTGGWERELICWNIANMQRALSVGLQSFVAQFSADGRQCAIVRDPPSVELCSFERPELKQEFSEELGLRVTHAAFSPDGRWLAASGSACLAVWDLANGGPAAIAGNAADTRLEFSSNGELFADRRNGCFRWKVLPGTNGAAPPRLEPLNLPVPQGFVSLCLDSNRAIFTSSRGSGYLDPDRTANGVVDWKPTIDGLSGISPDGRWLALFHSFGRNLHIYRMPEFEAVVTLRHDSNIHMLQFSPSGDELAVACGQGVEFWSTASWTRLRSATNFDNILYSRDGRAVWVSSNFRGAGLYEARTITPLLPLAAGTLPLALSADGRRLAVSVDARHLEVWDLAEMKSELAKLKLDWEQ